MILLINWALYEVIIILLRQYNTKQWNTSKPNTIMEFISAPYREVFFIQGSIKY